MMDVSGILVSVLVASLIAVVGPIAGAFFAKGTLLYMEKRRVLKRFLDEPYCRVGIIMAEILLGGSDRAIVGRCYIHSLKLGRIEVRVLDDSNEPTGHAMSWKLQEYEAFDPVVVLNESGNPIFKRPKN